MNNLKSSEKDRLTRWRLILGAEVDTDKKITLDATSKRTDNALQFLYGNGASKGRSRSATKVADWLKNIRELYDASIVHELQKEAIERLGLEQLILEKEFLQNAQPNAELLATIISLSQLMPDDVKEIARKIVDELVREIEKKLAAPLLASLRSGIRQSISTNRPNPIDVNWHRTIMANLKHFQKKEKTIIPEKWVGRKRKVPAIKHIVLLIDQSASMSSSLIYSAIFGSILSSVRSVSTRTYLFDSEVVDISSQLHDVVELLFSVQLGGGTDIANALKVVIQNLQHPKDTIFFLISDLEDTGNEVDTKVLFKYLVQEGVKCYNLVALNDEGRPHYNRQLAEELKEVGVPFMYSSPKEFPLLIEKALEHR